MSLHRINKLFILLLILIGACISCENNSESSNADTDVPVVEDSPIYGTWAGYFFHEVYSGGVGDPLDYLDDEDIFVIGIITPGENQQARFIGDTSQFVSDDIAFQDVPGFFLRKVFGGNFLYYTWNTLGMNWTTLGLNAPEKYYLAESKDYAFFGNTVFTTALLGGLYWPTDTEENHQFQTYNYNTSGVTADLSKLEGYWSINNSFKKGNTLTFTISQGSNLAVITGSDGLGNMFNGTITIQYNDYSNAPIFTVDMSMNGLVDLEGLVTYIETIDTQGISIDKSIAIGATNKDANDTDKHLVTGIAKKVE